MTRGRLLAITVVSCASVAAIALAVPLSGWGVATLVACTLLALGLATLRVRRGGLRGLTRAGVVLLALVPLGRIALAQRTASGTTATTTVPGTGPRVAAALIDEQDVVVPAAHAILLSGYLRRSEAEGLPEILAERYRAMRASEGFTVSPLLGTYVLGEHASRFDLVTVMPRAAATPRVAVVFLHGFAGSFVLPCWQLSRAARAIDAMTACPSTDWQGHWGRGSQGTRIVRATIDWLRARGVQRIYLAGISNGAIGAGDIAPRFAHELAGIVVISGGSRRSPPRGLPVLAVQGAHDTMTRPALARSYAARAGRRGTYVELEGNHFVFLARHEEARVAIARWLARSELGGSGDGARRRR